LAAATCSCENNWLVKTGLYLHRQGSGSNNFSTISEKCTNFNYAFVTSAANWVKKVKGKIHLISATIAALLALSHSGGVQSRRQLRTAITDFGL